jgi:hypothetical protein
MTWLTAVMVVWGAACLVLAFRVRTGRSRRFDPLYRTNAMWRNAPFVCLPAGIWWIAGAGAIVSSNAHVGVAVAVLTPVAFVFLILSLVWVFGPPEFMKPRWLR